MEICFMRLFTAATVVLTLTAGAAYAGPTTLWAVDVSNSGPGTAGSAYAEQFGLDGSLLRQVNLGSGFSPSGIALVGSMAYVSSSTDGLIRSYNLSSGTLLGSFSSGMNALGALTADATGLWANDYTGGNQALHYSFAGVRDRALTLSYCSSYCNALEIATIGGTSYLLANRGETEPSATYDLYSTGGAVTAAALISGVPNGAGAAYDAGPQVFYVADAYDGTVQTYSATGAALGTITLGGTAPDTGFNADFPGQRFVADLAVQVPEPATLALLAGGFGLAGLVRRRRA
jgi:hypothetical protein